MKFSKVASIAILALSAQAAIVQSNQEPTKAKKMSLPETLLVLLVLTFFLKENNYDALVKTMNYQVFFQFSLVQFLLLYQRSSRLSVVFWEIPQLHRLLAP